MNQTLRQNLIDSPHELVPHIISQLNGNRIAADWKQAEVNDDIKGSAVLFLITQKQTTPSTPPEPCLLLNKRSRMVLQPGDLCCPGGGVQGSDKILSRFLRLPFSPLAKWSQWPQWHAEHRQIARRMAVLLSTGLREAWEEMHLNPFKVSFLGPLRVQQLVLFKRQIFPLAAWMTSAQRLKPNWEVERIVYVPLRQLLEPCNYGRYRLTFKTAGGEIQRKEDFPCFIHQEKQGKEILWGATFRITMDFLKLVFDFQLPDINTLPVIQGKRGKTYLNGSLSELKGLAKEEGEYDY